jgi:hypothetical protein
MPKTELTARDIETLARLAGLGISTQVASEHAASFAPLLQMIAGLRRLPLKELEPPLVYRPEEEQS